MEVYPMAKCSTSLERLTPSENEIVTFAGIDYHKKFSVVTLGDKAGNVISTHRLANDPLGITDFFEQFGPLTCAVESCRGYEWFVDHLKALGNTVYLSNPYQTKLIAQTRCKTDKIDSRIIMELLAIGFLPKCYLPTQEERELRERLRWRSHLVRCATRMKIKIKILLDKENLGETLKNPFTKAGRKALCRVELKSETRQRLLRECLELLEHHEGLVAVEDKWIQQTAELMPHAQLLMTIPGIGALSALVILAELGDVSRFKKAEQVVSYAGLAPSVYSSGGTHRFGKISKQGPSQLRWILVQDAWQAIRYSPELRLHYLTVMRRRGAQSAILSLARKLLKISYRVLREQKPYDSSLVGVKNAN
jgi:transposase